MSSRDALYLLGTRIRSVQSDLTTLTADVALLDTRVDDVETDLALLDGRVDTVETDLATLDGRVDTVETDLNHGVDGHVTQGSAQR